MPTGDHPLTHPERSPIFALKSTDRSQRPMAEQLGRDVSTISRELSRHHGQRDYRHQQARASDEPAPGSLCRVLEDDPERWEAVEDRVKAGWSPEQTDGRAARCIVACATGEEAELSGRATRRLSTDGSLPGFRPRETGGGTRE